MFNEFIGSLKGKIFVSRSGSESGKTLGYGETIDAWYVSNSKRSIPSSGSEIQVGVMDVDKYKKIIDLLNNELSWEQKKLEFEKIGINKVQATILRDEYNLWFNNRTEISGPDGIFEGLKK